MKKVDKNMMISEVLAIDPGVVPILMEAGLHCLGCPTATRETLAEAGVAHGIDADELVEKINNHLESVQYSDN